MKLKQPKVIVLRTAGTNCDEETVFAFKYFGAQVDAVHINEFHYENVQLDAYHILVLPGGFTYGDDIESGRILANELRLKLGESIEKFIKDKKLIIGICNGFQVLVKAGLLPELRQRELDGVPQTATLTSNDSGKFEDRWVHLRVEDKSVWTEGLEEIVYYPVAHAEGKFIAESKKQLGFLEKNNQIAFRYCASDGSKPDYPDNPNGSINDIAGITDKTGRILGLMPHPERHFLFTNHPSWTRFEEKKELGEGARIFENGVRYVQKNLL